MFALSQLGLEALKHSKEDWMCWHGDSERDATERKMVETLPLVQHTFSEQQRRWSAETHEKTEHLNANLKCQLACLSPTELEECYVSPVCLFVSNHASRNLTLKSSKMPSNLAANQRCIPFSRKIKANHDRCCTAASWRIELYWQTAFKFFQNFW